MEIMSFLKPSCLLWTATLYSATVWQQIDSSAFIKKKKKRMKNKKYIQHYGGEEKKKQ